MAAKKRATARRRPRQAAPAPLSGDLTLLIGTISGTVQSLKEAVEADRDEWHAEREANATYRQGVRNDLDAIKEKVGKAFDATVNHATRITTLEATAGDYRSFRNKLAGAVFAFTIFWTVLGADIAAAVKRKVFS